MSNDTYLLNTRILTSDRLLLDAARERHGTEYAVVGEGPRVKIPIPWLCCFRQSDLRPSTYLGWNEDGSEYRLAVWLPCAPLSTALENLGRSLPLFEKLIGDGALARQYWQAALDAVKEFPLPFLTIDFGEFFDLNPVEEWADVIVGALSGRDDALPHMASLAPYDADFLPYTIEEIYSRNDLSGEKDFEQRNQNSWVLDMLLA